MTAGVGTQSTPRLRLAFGLAFEDLYRRDGLVAVDAAYRTWLTAHDSALAARLDGARASTELPEREEAALLIALAPSLDVFIGELFGIADEIAELRTRHEAFAPLLRFKWKFVKRRALLAHPDPAVSLAAFDPIAARAQLEAWMEQPFEERAFASAVRKWESDGLENRVDLAIRYCAWAALTPDGQHRHKDSVLFRHPRDVDPYALLEHVQTVPKATGTRVICITPDHLRQRPGFTLTDAGAPLARALDEATYCIKCHEQGKDSCSTGMREKVDAGAPARFRRSPLGVTLAGCPLGERISEFHTVKTQGHAVAALALIAIENPLVAGTGHRICNDCVRACIYQKQTPVDIPRAETRTLRDVLELPWGFEIYSLLTRWNPLDLRRPLPRPDTGRKVLVAGMGPAGYTLAHHLMNDGHVVVGIDGLKIEPLPADWSGRDTSGARVPFEPVYDADALASPLDERVMAGFGGVAEYGITVRWDKNFLTLIRLLLERRDAFALYGGVRLGSTLTTDDAFALGFDHVALALGAGRPTTLDVPNGLARGVRTASDFLMALQLTGAAKADSIANMQLRLPVVVIGGGLTAVDAATEALAYYPVQVGKFLDRYESLCRLEGEHAVREGWTDEERVVAEEFLAHGRAIRAERARAQRDGGPAHIAELLQHWGGATIAYRRHLLDSPAYTLNHEELAKALEEGVHFAECVRPARLDVDAWGAVHTITMTGQQRGESALWRDTGDSVWPARTVLVAAGTRPNTVLAGEEPHRFTLEGRFFQAIDEDGQPVTPDAGDAKPPATHVLTTRIADGRAISFFGDLHPNWSGNVVKAMASAQRGYPVLSRVLAQHPAASTDTFETLRARLDLELRPVVESARSLAPGIVELAIRAPMAARHFQPGQFYRLQNFETLAPRVTIDGQATRLAMEGLAVTGASVMAANGLVKTIVLDAGASSRLCALLRPGEPVVLMGPTGAPTDIPRGDTVLLVGGGLGNAVLFSIGTALRAAGSRVLYFAAYKQATDRVHVADIEAAADQVVWCCDTGGAFVPGRAQDRAFAGNVVDALLAYARHELGAPGIALGEVDRILAIGSDRMMAAVAQARQGALARWLKPGHQAIGSINSPMQCMMKEICAQCLQTHRDPVTGQETQVFSCANQDQPLDRVDFPMLAQRLRQNSLQEKLTARWLSQGLQTLIVQRNNIP